jgi:hypothetical protein
VPAKKPRKQIDARRIFLHAEKFHWVVDHLLRGENVPHVDKIDHPATTMSAFTSELYFKCLISIIGNDIPGRREGHDLKKLFEAVNPSIRARIVALWDDHIWERHRRNFLALVETKIPDGPIKRDLNWALTAGSRSFEQARYLYEDEAPDLRFVLCDLPAILRATILEIRPDWR